MGKHGVWLTYQAPEYSELLTSTGKIFDVVGIQVRVGDRFVCTDRGSSSGATIEWTAEANQPYYILVTDPTPDLGQQFELTMQSMSIIAEPTSPVTPNPPAPAASPVAVDLAAPTGSTVSPQGTPSGSIRGALNTTISLMLLALSISHAGLVP